MSFARVPFALVFALIACSSSDDEQPSDARTRAASYARDDIACTAAADCCVVFDGCRAQGLVVAAADQAHVASLLASAPNEACVKCIPPAVDVRCVAGKCTGVVMQPPSGGDPTSVPEAMKDHCGELTFPPGWSAEPSSASGAAPGSSQETILGC